MPITAQYDRDADALYVRLTDGDRVRAIEIDDATYVDVDADDRPVGIELLYPAMGVNLDAIAKRLSLESKIAGIIAAIAATDAPVASLTMTGGQHIASTKIMFSAVEGSIAAGGAVVGSSTSAPPAPLIHACVS